MKSLIEKCPNGCESSLRPAGLIVPGGELNQCSVCGQLVSSTSEEHFTESNQHWDKAEGTWPDDRSYVRLLRRKTRDIRNITRLLHKDCADIRILDVGCSNGVFVHIANSLGMQAEGVDTSPQAVDDGLKKGLKLHQGYLQDIAFKDESFDVVTMYEVIEHVADSADLIKECARILRPGGLLLIGTGNANSWTRFIRRGKWDFLNDHVGHVNFFSPQSLKSAAPRFGFHVVKVVTYSVKFFEKNEVNPVVYRLMKIFGEILNLPARWFDRGHQMEVYLRRDPRR
jgi:2-polyprenyl-3-methyl-5-hydroxy-6-metoxy-1,4-benzoquinol methylase